VRSSAADPGGTTPTERGAWGDAWTAGILMVWGEPPGIIGFGCCVVMAAFEDTAEGSSILTGAGIISPEWMGDATLARDVWLEGKTRGTVPYESGDVVSGSGVALTRSGAVPYVSGDAAMVGALRLGTASLVCAVPAFSDTMTGWGAAEGIVEGTKVLGAPTLASPAACTRGWGTEVFEIPSVFRTTSGMPL